MSPIMGDEMPAIPTPLLVEFDEFEAGGGSALLGFSKRSIVLLARSRRSLATLSLNVMLGMKSGSC